MSTIPIVPSVPPPPQNKYYSEITQPSTPQQISPAQQTSAPPQPKHVSISVMTMNMWNVDYYLEDRMDYICDLVSKLSPDLVAFQEVSWDQVRTIVQNLHADDYDIYESTGRNRRHGELIASRLPIYRTEHIPFQNTDMQRGLTVAEIDLPGGQSLYFVTAQMESSDDGYDRRRTDREQREDRDYYSRLRRQQIKDMYSLFRHKKRVIFAGDMNKTTEEYVKMPTQWHDAWIQSGQPKDKQFTFDGERNPNAMRGVQERLDRILYKKPETESWHVTQFGLAGLKSILKSSKGEPVLPSDHYGVFTRLNMILPPDDGNNDNMSPNSPEPKKQRRKRKRNRHRNESSTSINNSSTSDSDSDTDEMFSSSRSSSRSPKRRRKRLTRQRRSWSSDDESSPISPMTLKRRVRRRPRGLPPIRRNRPRPPTRRQIKERRHKRKRTRNRRQYLAGK